MTNPEAIRLYNEIELAFEKRCVEWPKVFMHTIDDKPNMVVSFFDTKHGMPIEYGYVSKVLNQSAGDIVTPVMGVVYAFRDTPFERPTNPLGEWRLLSEGTNP